METKSRAGKSTLSRPVEIFTDDDEAPLATRDAFPLHERQQWSPVAPKSTKTTQPRTAIVNAMANDDDDLFFPVPAALRAAADPWSDVEDEPDPDAMTTASDDADSQADDLNAADDDTEDEAGDGTVEARDDDAIPSTPDRGGAWTLPMLCLGIAMIACSLLLPLAEDNHQLVYQRDRLKLDLQQVKKQVAVNDDFLNRIKVDPTLAERLAQRQMKTIRKGEAVLDIGSSGRQEMSPFMLVTVPPPAPMPAYRPVGGALTAVTRNARTRLFVLGGGLLLLMCGLVLGSPAKQPND